MRINSCTSRYMVCPVSIDVAIAIIMVHLANILWIMKRYVLFWIMLLTSKREFRSLYLSISMNRLFIPTSFAFLKNNQNAFVFPNHHIYPMLDKIYQILNDDAMDAEIDHIQQAAYETASTFTLERMAPHLFEFYRNFS